MPLWILHTCHVDTDPGKTPTYIKIIKKCSKNGKNEESGGRGVVQLVKLIALQGRGAEFNPQNPCKKPDVEANTYILVLWRQRRHILGLLTSSLAHWPSPGSQRESLSWKPRRIAPQERMVPKGDLWLPHVHTSPHAIPQHTYIHAHEHAPAQRAEHQYSFHFPTIDAM